MLCLYMYGRSWRPEGLYACHKMVHVYISSRNYSIYLRLRVPISQRLTMHALKLNLDKIHFEFKTY